MTYDYGSIEKAKPHLDYYLGLTLIVASVQLFFLQVYGSFKEKMLLMILLIFQATFIKIIIRLILMGKQS